MKTKRIILLSLVICLLFASNVFASELSFDVVDNADVKTYTATLKIDEESNICGGSFNISYDNNSLKIEKCDKGELLSNISAFVNPNYSENSIRVSFASLTPIVDGGRLVILEFSLLNENINQTAITIERASFTDYDGNKLNVVATNGVIEVKKDVTDDTSTDTDNNDTSDSDINNENNSRPTISNRPSSNASGKTPSKTEQTDKENENIQASSPQENESVKIEFSDVDNHFAKKEIEYLADKGIINGYVEEDSVLFKPNQFITREEFIKIICSASFEDEIENIDENPFADWNEVSEWAKKYLYQAFKNEIVLGEKISETEYNCNPKKNITRAEAMVIISRLLDIEETIDNLEFLDENEIPQWAITEVKQLTSLKILNGYEDNTIRVNNNITRGETAVIIYRFLEVKENTK